jgi:hypothetical protein
LILPGATPKIAGSHAAAKHRGEGMPHASDDEEEGREIEVLEEELCDLR